MKKPELRDIQNEFYRQIKNKDGQCKIEEAKHLGELFLAHYESNGWMVGKNKMKRWKMAVSTWVLQRKRYEPQWKQLAKQEQEKRQSTYINQERDYGDVDYEKYKARLKDQKSNTKNSDNAFNDFKQQYFERRGQGESGV